MTKNTFYLIILIISLSYTTESEAQKILFYETFYTDCITKKYDLEKDSAYMSVDGDDIRHYLKRSVSRREWRMLRGDLYLQIIVNPWGESCLLSMRNETNLKTHRFKLKRLIDRKLKWGFPNKPVAPVLHIAFTGHGVQIMRLGTAIEGEALTVIPNHKIE